MAKTAAQPRNIATVTVTAANQFSDGVQMIGDFNISLFDAGGAFAANIVLQRSFDEGATWFDVNTFTAMAQKIGLSPEHNVWWRIGCKAGNYTSGSIQCRISQ